MTYADLHMKHRNDSLSVGKVMVKDYRDEYGDGETSVIYADDGAFVLFPLGSIYVALEQPAMRILDICPGLPRSHELYGKDCIEVKISAFEVGSWSRLYALVEGNNVFFDTFPPNAVYIWLEHPV